MEGENAVIARRYQEIKGLAEFTAKMIVSSEEDWKKFLHTAGHMYKYPFKEQMLIYAQRPDATACASLELWNEKMNCWVNKGAQGIALIDLNDPPKMVHRSTEYPACWEVENGTDSEIVVLFRSYPGALVRYHVDRTSGETYVTKEVPGITDGEERTDETLNVRIGHSSGASVNSALNSFLPGTHAFS